MRILFISEYYHPHIGGIEVVVENLARELVNLGHEALVITSRLPGTSAYEELSGVKVYRTAVPPLGGRYLFNFLAIPPAWKLARKCDIVHTAGENNIFLGWFVAGLSHKKKVVTIHEPLGSIWGMMGMNPVKAKFHQIAERLLLSLHFDKHICVSRYTRNCLRFHGVKDEKLTIIYNGIDNSLFAARQTKNPEIRKKLNIRDEFVYMYYGRPGITKGVQYLVRAVPLISEQIPGAKLLLLLANDPRDGYDAVMTLIKGLKIEDKVVLLKPVPRGELPDYVAVADCIVVPSLSEGFGFTAAEACAMEKAVVASDVGSLPEVTSGRYILVEPGNPKAIADGVRIIYSNGVRPTDKKIFSWDRCVKEYLEVYDKISA